MRYLIILALIFPLSVSAGSLTTRRIIKAGEVLTAQDVQPMETTINGALQEPEDAIGQEARVTLYPGRPIMFQAIGKTRIIARNEIVRLNYISANIAITTEGRALSAGSVGETIRIINLGSRNTVSGRVMPDGSINVAQAHR